MNLWVKKNNIYLLGICVTVIVLFLINNDDDFGHRSNNSTPDAIMGWQSCWEAFKLKSEFLKEYESSARSLLFNEGVIEMCRLTPTLSVDIAFVK